jgi:hypothetical protein
MLVLAIITFRMYTRYCWDGRTNLTDQLYRTLIKADLRLIWLIGLRVEIQDIFHPPDEICPYGRAGYTTALSAKV